MEISAELRQELIATAHALADAARIATLDYFRTDRLATQNKADGAAFDPVTAADKACERAMRAILAARRPQDGILGEEEAPVDSQSGLTWVLDPIDGTRAFLSGLPCWGVLIAVNAGDAPLLGIIDQPFNQERFIGGLDLAEHTHRNTSRPLRTRQTNDLADAILFSTFPEVGTTAERQAFERVRDKVRLTRYGTDCYAYGLLALGQIDLVIEAGLHPYDIQGPMAVVEAAGGIVTDWSGGPVHQGGQVLAAATKALHEKALMILSD